MATREGLAGMEMVSSEANTTRRRTSRAQKKALRRNREKKPSSYRNNRPYNYEFIECLEETNEEDDILEYISHWDRLYADYYGSFEDETTLRPMRHTFGPIPDYAIPDCTLQIFYIRVDEINKDGLQWPLDVHGLVAARDHADPNRNYLFNSTRDNCQTLTQEDPYLLLTGPSRAIMLLDPLDFEVQLEVKSKTEPEKDEVLAFTIFSYSQVFHSEDVIRTRIWCKRCTLEFAHAPLLPSVEATVSVQVVDGSWEDCFRGAVTCHTASMKQGRMLLLDSRDGKMPVHSNGVIELSRRVVSVELSGKLIVSVLAYRMGDEGLVAQDEDGFAPQKAGTSHGMFDLGFCKMQVTIAWSVLSTLMDLRNAAKYRVSAG